MKVLREGEIKIIKDLLSLYPEPQSAILPSLWVVQNSMGYIPDEAVFEIAEILQVSPSKIFDALSFYTLFKRKPSGRYHIQVCTNISCSIGGAEKILEAIKETLHISPGERTPDGLFSLSTVECLGACGEAPVVQINEKYYVKMSPEKLESTILELKERQ